MFFVVLKLCCFVRKKTIIPVLRFILVSIFPSQCNVNLSSFLIILITDCKIAGKKCIGKEIDYWASTLDIKSFLNIGHNVNRFNVYVFNVYQKYFFETIFEKPKYSPIIYVYKYSFLLFYATRRLMLLF